MPRHFECDLLVVAPIGPALQRFPRAIDVGLKLEPFRILIRQLDRLNNHRAAKAKLEPLVIDLAASRALPTVAAGVVELAKARRCAVRVGPQG